MSDSETSSPLGAGASTAQALLDQVIRATMAKDKDAVLAAFAPDALFIDPHYPHPEMRGRDEIAAGLDWGFRGMERFKFTVVGSFTAADGNSGAVEMDCEHVLAGGRVLAFPQVFVAETKDGLLIRLRAYEPYGPGKLVMSVIRLQNWWLRVRSKPRGSGRG